MATTSEKDLPAAPATGAVPTQATDSWESVEMAVQTILPEEGPPATAGVPPAEGVGEGAPKVESLAVATKSAIFAEVVAPQPTPREVDGDAMKAASTHEPPAPEPRKPDSSAPVQSKTHPDKVDVSSKAAVTAKGPADPASKPAQPLAAKAGKPAPTSEKAAGGAKTRGEEFSSLELDFFKRADELHPEEPTDPKRGRN